MNFEKLTAYSARGTNKLKEKGFVNPVLVAGKTRGLVSDGLSTIIFDFPTKTKFTAERPSLYVQLCQDFEEKKADVVSFKTTVGDLVVWLRKDTEACAFCGGAGVCPSIQVAMGLKKDEDAPPELSDADALHYGWIGPCPIDRSLLDELLEIVEVPPETEIMLHAVMNERHHQSTPERESTMFCSVWVKAADWEIFLAGRTDKVEAAPKFHLEGKFEQGSFQAAKTKKTKAGTTPAPKAAVAATKKAAPKVQAKKAAPKAQSKKAQFGGAAANSKVKVPTGRPTIKKKAPPVKIAAGSSLLDAARAKRKK